MITTVPVRARAAAAALMLASPWAFAQAPPSPTAWEPRGPGGGGALFAPSLSPHSTSDMFVACDMSELFRTRDFGRTWTQADFRVIQGNRASQVHFTPDPQVLYTIDHSTRNLVDLREPVKSTDGGATWQPLPGDPTGADSYAMLGDPNDAQRVFVVDYMNLHASRDGGQSFRQVYTDATGGAGAYLAGIYSEGDLVLIGTNAGLLVSNDGGQSFQLNPGLAGIDFGAEAMTGFAASREGATLRLVCVTHGSGDVYLDMYACEHWGYQSVYVMDWGTGTWTRATNGIPAGDHPFFAGMSRGEADVMWLAGGSDAGSPVVLRSTNGGASWQPVLLTAGNQNVATGWQGQGGDRGWGYGECAQGFGVSPTDPLRAAISDFGYVHVTDDGGATWRQAYVDPATQHPAGSTTPQRRFYGSVGLENTTCWDVLWVDAQTLIAGYSDIRGTRSEDGGATWGFDYSGHADNSMYRSVRQPTTGTIFAATASVHDMYQSTRLADNILDPGTGRVLFSTDGGNAWQTMRDFGDVVVWVELDPSEPETLYASVVNRAAGTGGVWRTRNASLHAAATWQQLPAPPRTEGHPFNVRVLRDGTIVATYSGRRNAGGAFTASSGVFVSTDDGASWIDRSDPGMHYWTKDLVVDPADATQSTWHVGVFSGWGGPPNGLGGLYRTRDRGQSWTRVYDLDRVTSLAIDPRDPDHAYLTTETEGLWETRDLSAASPAFTQVAEYPFRQPERVFWNPFDLDEIWVTSFGNGLRVGRSVTPPAGPDLLRNTDVTSLLPLTPALSALLPLDPAPAGDLHVADVTSPVTDPDATVVGDPTRPLVFYEVTGSVVIRLSITAGRQVQVAW